MPFDSQGIFTRVHNWEDDRINNIEIVTDHHDEEDENFAEGLSNTFLRDGRVPMEGNLNVGHFQIKNVASGTIETDAVNKAQLDSLQTKIQEKIDEMTTRQDNYDSLQLGTTCVSNCIMSAPNGVVSISENQLVIPKGLTVLIPSGRDWQKKLHSIVYTVPETKVVSVTSGNNLSLILDMDGTAQVAVYKGECHDFPVFTNPDEYFYHTGENYMYKSGGAGHWTRKQVIVIAKNIVVSGSTLSAVQPLYPVRLLGDSNQGLITQWMAPDYTRGMAISKNFQAPCSGWVYGTVYGSDQVTNYVYVNGVDVLRAYREHADTAPMTLFLGQGDVISFSNGSSSFVFYPCKGAN